MEWITTALGGLRDNWAETLLGVSILLVLTGRIVPKFRLDEARQDRDAWRTAYEKERDARTVAEADQGERGRMQDLMARLMGALTPPGGGGNGST